MPARDGGTVHSLTLQPDSPIFCYKKIVNRPDALSLRLSVPTQIGQTSDSMDYKKNTGSFTNNLRNVNRFNTLSIHHATIPDDRAQVLQWLSPLRPQRRHQHLRQNRLGGVGQWIFQKPEFQRWNTVGDRSSDSVLFCYGDPGVGKTYLSSQVVDYFVGTEQNLVVTGLYCDYLGRKEQTTSNMLGAMLGQLVGGGDIPEDIRKAFEDDKSHFGGVGPQVPELVKMLKTAIARRRRVILCIDGLDESLAAHRTGLLSSLQTILQELPNVRLFLTGRVFIRHEVEKYFPGMATVPVSPTMEDTREFLRMKLARDIEPYAMDQRLRADIMETIPKKISETFLLVSLSIDAILGETTIRRREKKLEQISKCRGIEDVYTATLERIRAQGTDRSRLGMEAIMWVVHSERSLRPEELCQALGVERGLEDLNSRNVPSIRTILNCGMGLVTVDSWSSTVRLVHFTLQEYILANPTFFYSPHSLIAEVCLTYLNFKYIRNLSPALSSPPPATPFLEYASCYWGEHARREATESVISLALKLLDKFDTHVSCKLLLLSGYKSRHLFDIPGRPAGFTGLHGGALLGVTEIMAPLIEFKKWDFNATDPHGYTALQWATRAGHSGVVEVLLEQESVDPDIADNRGQTPLSWAAEHGEVVILRMLLERGDVNPNAADEDGITPLLAAIMTERKEFVEIVKILLEKADVDADTADESGRTPLLWAAPRGQKEIVEMLLGRSDVNPDITDEEGRTPLSCAAEGGHEGIVKMLLERSDANPNMLDRSGRTPLSWAAENWQVEVVKILLERSDVDPNTADERGRTPFSLACSGLTDEDPDGDYDTEGCVDRERYVRYADNECERIAKMLLGRDDIIPDRADKRGRTPFSWAASHGHEEMVEILLGRNDVDPDSADESGQTPLSWAAAYGHEGIVGMLLAQGTVNPDARDKSGRTPLSWAAGGAGGGVVRMLLERSDVDPEAVDKDGRTPLSHAQESWDEETVDMLLERRRTCLPSVREEGGAEFLPAAENRHEGNTDMSLEQCESGPSVAHAGSGTPCPRVSGGEHEGNQEVSLEPSDVNPETADKDGKTPLPCPQEFWDNEIVDMFLDLSNAGPTTAADSGRTSFPSALGSVDEGIVNKSLELCEFNRDTSRETGRSPFPRVAGGGSDGIQEMLFDWEDVGTLSESGRARSPQAGGNGSTRVGQLLDAGNELIPESVLKEQSSEPVTTEPSGSSEPTAKRVRRL